MNGIKTKEYEGKLLSDFSFLNMYMYVPYYVALKGNYFCSVLSCCSHFQYIIKVKLFSQPFIFHYNLNIEKKNWNLNQILIMNKEKDVIILMMKKKK